MPIPDHRIFILALTRQGQAGQRMDGQKARAVVDSAMAFFPSAALPDPLPASGRIFLFDETGMVVSAPAHTVPVLDLDQATALTDGGLHFFGSLDQVPCFCGRLTVGQVPAPLVVMNLRKFFHESADDLRAAASLGRQVADLHLNFKFCGRCSAPTESLTGEHGRTCPACGLHAWPRISPAVIMAVTRKDEILLARGRRFPNPKMFSVLAGFVSPGETLEACVEREVFEETAIRVDRVSYAGSQPWPFPDSLMIGFTAAYQSGQIQIDPGEIAEAAWFRADALPLIPDAYTIAGQLIRNFAKAWR